MQRAYSELVREGQAARQPLLGVMVEVPSTIYQIADLAKRVDFFSVGTNDLTQYLLAIDRANALVARHYDSLHPAVLRAINQAVAQARVLGNPLSVCGEMAGDPESAILLVGMGINALSMASPSLPHVKRAIRVFSRQRAQELSAAALSADDSTGFIGSWKTHLRRRGWAHCLPRAKRKLSLLQPASRRAQRARDRARMA